MEHSNAATSKSWLMPGMVINAFAPPGLLTGQQTVVPSLPIAQPPSQSMVLVDKTRASAAVVRK